eukprot:6182871-Pleurochrysis_carterae.AAC.3
MRTGHSVKSVQMNYLMLPVINTARTNSRKVSKAATLGLGIQSSASMLASSAARAFFRLCLKDIAFLH